MNRYVYPNRIIVLRFAQICLFSSTRSMVSTTGSPASWHCKYSGIFASIYRSCWEGVDGQIQLFFPYPIGSMYGIYANIGGILMVNVTICPMGIARTLWYNSLLLKPWPSRNVVSFPMNSMGGSFHFVM